jgi:hypothetical protein
MSLAQSALNLVLQPSTVPPTLVIVDGSVQHARMASQYGATMSSQSLATWAAGVREPPVPVLVLALVLVPPEPPVPVEPPPLPLDVLLVLVGLVSVLLQATNAAVEKDRSATIPSLAAEEDERFMIKPP